MRDNKWPAPLGAIRVSIGYSRKSGSGGVGLAGFTPEPVGKRGFMKDILKRLLGNPRFLVAAGYVVYLLLFYFIGITKARFSEFLVFAVVTGFYALVVIWVRKISGK